MNESKEVMRQEEVERVRQGEVVRKSDSSGSRQDLVRKNESKEIMRQRK